MESSIYVQAMKLTTQSLLTLTINPYSNYSKSGCEQEFAKGGDLRRFQRTGLS